MAETKTFNELLADFGGSRGLFKAMNDANPGEWFSHQRLHNWKQTQKFPFSAFNSVKRAADHANVEGVTLEALNNMANEANK